MIEGGGGEGGGGVGEEEGARAHGVLRHQLGQYVGMVSRKSM